MNSKILEVNYHKTSNLKKTILIDNQIILYENNFGI